MKQVFKANQFDQICLSNKYSPLEGIKDLSSSLNESDINFKSKYAKKRVNKRLSEQYQPTFLSSKYVQRYTKVKQHETRNPCDINGLEIELMKKIRSSPNLNGNLRSNINSHIEYLEKQNAGLGSKNDFDISCTNDLKLKGGAKHLKLKTFNSDNIDVNIALNLFRSTNILGQFIKTFKIRFGGSGLGTPVYECVSSTGFY